MYNKMVKKCLILLIALSYCLIDGGSATTNTGSCADGADKNCGQCLFSLCVMCWGMYADNNGICQAPTVKIDNCMVYYTATECLICKLGYKDVSNVCKKLSVANCVEEETIGTCTACYRYFLDSGKCEQACPSDCLNCTITSIETTCDNCQGGYAWTTSDSSLLLGEKHQCKQQSDPLNNCYSKSSKCVTCLPGGYVSSKSTEEMKCTGGESNASVMAIIISALLSFLSL